jgi:ankyrin repeat protein
MEFSELVTRTGRQVREAINAGADINFRDPEGMTPLMWASMFNTDPEVITALLEAGAVLEARDNHGITPLMYAAEFNHNRAVIVTLLKAREKGEARNSVEKLLLKSLRYTDL